MRPRIMVGPAKARCRRGDSRFGMMPAADPPRNPFMQIARRFRLPLAVAALVLAAGAVQAAPPKRHGGVVGKGDGPIMSMAELRACVARQTRLSAQRQEMVKAQEQMNTEGAALAKAGEALQAEVATLDRTNKELLE